MFAGKKTNTNTHRRIRTRPAEYDQIRKNTKTYETPVAQYENIRTNTAETPPNTKTYEKYGRGPAEPPPNTKTQGAEYEHSGAEYDNLDFGNV